MHEMLAELGALVTTTPRTRSLKARNRYPPIPPWRANTLYLAHFTVSDIADGAFHDHERLSRGHGACGCRSRHLGSVAG
ncbi:MAG: lipocalin-like domain-containing protein [Gammaproteobacteria bacterium]